MPESVSIGDLAAILAAPARKPGGNKKIDADTSIRTVTVWFKLPGKFGECNNPACTNERPAKMVNEVNGQLMCRECFYAGYAK